MKQADSSHDKSFDNGWKLMGDLKLSANQNADTTISVWLTESLNPLDLQVDFLNKVITSAQDAVAHISLANTMMVLKHYHLLVFAPAHRLPERQCWGFFRIEKIESVQTEKHSSDHAIEFYLYQER